MRQLHPITLIIATLLASWLGMQAVHELGHILTARLSGGQVERVILHPLTISRTDLADNPHPLAVAWGGPTLGVLIPLIVFGAAAISDIAERFVLRFFAGFCLVANGVYLGVGSFLNVGDAGDIVRHGSPAWTMWLFGAVCVQTGFWLWNGLGPHFGLGPDPRPISRRVVLEVVMTCVALLILGFWIGR